MSYAFYDKDGALFRVQAGEYPFRSAELYDPNDKEWVPYTGSMVDLISNGTPVKASELGLTDEQLESRIRK